MNARQRCWATVLLLASMACPARDPDLAPAEVRELAAAALPAGLAPADHKTAARAWLRDFFDGFTHAGKPSSHRTGTALAAYEAGRTFWHAQTQKRAEIMAGYGWVATERVGIWLRHFEMSRFDALDRRAPGCWFRLLDGARNTMTEAPKAVPAGPPLRVRGYLSPPGRYGHMGMYRCLFLATSIVPEPQWRPGE